MTEDTIDFKALFEQVQQENEALRIAALKRRAMHIDWLGVLDEGWGFASNHSTAIIIGIMAAYYLGSLAIQTYRVLKGK